jgi:hypothetical protein
VLVRATADGTVRVFSGEREVAWEERMMPVPARPEVKRVRGPMRGRYTGFGATSEWVAETVPAALVAMAQRTAAEEEWG